MLEIFDAIKQKWHDARLPPYRFPDHIENNQLNMSLLMLQMDKANRPNPNVQVSPVTKNMALQATAFSKTAAA